ncbi:MAG TPA: cyclic nucleotide-binding domain-containing protein [Terriglobales bacterium]|nr:cyclic nucleotide-binding domain-containing protein [Terriglobales bacterium]
MRKAIHLLGILDDIDIDWLASNGRVVPLSTGTVLIHEGKPIDSIYFLLDGELQVVVGAQEQLIATLLPGEIVGEISFVDSHSPSASVVATRNSQVLAVGRDVVTSKLSRDQGFATRFYYAIARFLADRLYVTVGRFGYGSARQDVDVDELDDAAMDQVDLGTVRFDKLLRRLRGDYQTASVAVH